MWSLINDLAKVLEVSDEIRKPKDGSPWPDPSGDPRVYPGRSFSLTPNPCLYTMHSHRLPHAPPPPSSAEHDVWGPDERHLLSPSLPVSRDGATVQGEVSHDFRLSETLTPASQSFCDTLRYPNAMTPSCGGGRQGKGEGGGPDAVATGRSWSQLPVETSPPGQWKGGKQGLLCSARVQDSPDEHRMGSPGEQSVSRAGGHLSQAFPGLCPTARWAQKVK